jgi:hypothetical protein
MPSKLYQIGNKVFDLNKIVHADYNDDNPEKPLLTIHLANTRTILIEGFYAEETWRVLQTCFYKPKDPLMPPVPDYNDPEEWITNYGTTKDKEKWELLKSRQRIARSLKQKPL